MATEGIDRRKFTRYQLPSMYSRIMVRPLDSDEFLWEGHAYDISRGGIRFELDRGIEPGEQVALRIDLPQTASERSTARRSVFVFANVIWMSDPDEIGPVRLAAAFSRFAREGDEEQLQARLSQGRYALAA
ncbi:MAG: PilZ domain-containing protein [Phycisphaeraceae bacterium]|nr:PilZ domain-containing protein [Phycisphaeraceae bacterium]MCB9847419.1 PilZ domain-containing protein [Phycisphaeraceae bacterium]